MTKSPASRIPDQLLDAIRERVPVLEIVQRHVPMRRAGAWWTGLCPFHGEKSPSFSVHPQRRSYHCFGCGAHGDVIGFLVRQEGRPFREVVAQLASEAGLQHELEAAGITPGWATPKRPVPAPVAARDTGPSEADRRAWPELTWRQAEPIAEGSPQALYLAGRGLWPLPACAHLVLRAARLRHRETGNARHPVMLARVDAADGTLSAVHRTYLAEDAAGRWRKLGGVENAKLSLGLLGGGAAIRLCPAGPVLGLAEGIETALAARLLHGVDVWSCISAGGLAAVSLPFDVERAVIFADRDKPKLPGVDGYRGSAMPEGPGMYAARHLVERLRPLAVASEIRLPRAPLGDYADVLAMLRGAGTGLGEGEAA